ncbi:MAG: ATP-binding protein [Rhodobacteraceae bacterium]|nr:ATP-binding protein [Paracoccaceae bacterium]
MPTHLVGDAGRIRQVLTNLLGNAVKFTQAGSVAVRVVGRPGGPGYRHVTVSIEDTGIGIAPEMRRHIFGEFNQVEDEMNRRFDGTGLVLLQLPPEAPHGGERRPQASHRRLDRTRLPDRPGRTQPSAHDEPARRARASRGLREGQRPPAQASRRVRRHPRGRRSGRRQGRLQALRPPA